MRSAYRGKSRRCVERYATLRDATRRRCMSIERGRSRLPVIGPESCHARSGKCPFPCSAELSTSSKLRLHLLLLYPVYGAAPSAVPDERTQEFRAKTGLCVHSVQKVAVLVTHRSTVRASL
jgi:hypothetical protein